MKLLYVPLSRDMLEALRDRARRARRRPQDEAALLLERVLAVSTIDPQATVIGQEVTGAGDAA